MKDPFTFVEIRNCRRYLKRIYTLSSKIDTELLLQFEDLGVLTIQQFSKYDKIANDTFKIRLDDEVEISGTLNDTLCFVTLAKFRLELVTFVEEIFINWVLRGLDRSENEPLQIL